MKFFLKTFGCRVNQVESQAIFESFASRGWTPVYRMEEADICLLNTCTVTHQADKDVEKLVRQIIRRNPSSRLILTGCYAAAHDEHIRRTFPQAEIIGKYDLGRKLFETEDICWTVSGHEKHSRAFIKIQDGCDCFCSYCIVPFARRVKRSKPVQDVLKEIRSLVQKGFGEIVLTGINIGNYSCPQSNKDLAALCADISRLEGHFRVRFSSIELQTVTQGIIEAMSTRPDRFCNYLHLPLQSGCDRTLKNMNRHYTTSEYAEKVAALRARVKGVSVFADVIAGFPTETEEDFEKSYRFIEEQKLCGLHVFSYSPRPLTQAASLPQLSLAVIKKRAERLRALDKTLRAEFAHSLVGTEQEVFAEEYSRRGLCGVTSNFQHVIIENPPENIRGLVRVRILRAESGAAYAQLL